VHTPCRRASDFGRDALHGLEEKHRGFRRSHKNARVGPVPAASRNFRTSVYEDIR